MMHILCDLWDERQKSRRKKRDRGKDDAPVGVSEHPVPQLQTFSTVKQALETDPAEPAKRQDEDKNLMGPERMVGR